MKQPPTTVRVNISVGIFFLQRTIDNSKLNTAVAVQAVASKRQRHESNINLKLFSYENHFFKLIFICHCVNIIIIFRWLLLQTKRSFRQRKTPFKQRKNLL